MAELLSSYKMKVHKTGERVNAKLIEVTKNSAIFDIGGKSEAVIVDDYFGEAKSFLTKMKPGEEVAAVVVNPESPDGRVLLSVRNTISDIYWRDLEEKKRNGQKVSVFVRAVGEKGLSVDCGSLGGFIPSSQMGSEVLKRKHKLTGETLQVKVIEISRDKNRLLFSEKAVSEAEDIALKTRAIEKMKLGEVYKGRVVQIANFGAFVEVKLLVEKKKIAIEGLVHVSELSWDKVDNVSEVLLEGDEVSVKLIDKNDSKLAFSVRQTQKDPWQAAVEKYKPDKKVEGEVVKISDFGVFVQLEPGIEGLVHMTKIPPATKLRVGDKVNVYVEELDPQEKRISLGLILTSKPVGYK